MQLSDAEVREILIRRKREKKRRLRRRRRRTFIILLLLIVFIFVLVKVIGHGGKKSAEDKKSADAAASGKTRGIIFIDPGHGGMDSGSDDDNDRYEKDDTLKLGLAVRDQLEALGFKVVMSRTEDEMVDRTERGLMANKAGAQLFISIHRNKADSGGKGVEGFIPKEDDKESRLLGENIIHFLGRAGFEERTIRAGTLTDPNDDYEENAAAEMPSVLIEVGFLSSDDDNYRFDTYLDKNAKAIADAINYTFMQLHDPDAAAEYAKMLTQTDEVLQTALTATGEALSGLNAIQSRAADGTIEGIDPEA